MTANGFGYVEIKDGKVKAVVGDSSNPTIHYFENEEIVQAVTFFQKCKKDYPHLWKYTLELLKNQRTDQDKENEKKAERLQQFLEYLLQLSTDGKLTDQAQGILIVLGNWVKLGEEKFNPYLRSDRL